MRKCLFYALLFLSLSQNSQADPTIMESLGVDYPETKFAVDFRDFSIVQINPKALNAPSNSEFYHLLNARMKLEYTQSSRSKFEGHLVTHFFYQSLVGAGEFGTFSLTGSRSAFVVDPLLGDVLDRDDLALALQPDRFVYSWRADDWSLALGRQAVTFARTFFWNPNDWIAPFTQNTIDREYKRGVDAIRFDAWFGRLTNVSLLYAAGDDFAIDKSAVMAKLSTSITHLDMDLLVGRIRDDIRTGIGWIATPDWLLGASLQSEATIIFPDDGSGDPFLRATLGSQYRFPSSLDIVVEYHYNGFGVGSAANYGVILVTPEFMSGEFANLGQHYVGLNLGYELTPLWQINHATIVNLVDGSFSLSPNSRISLFDEFLLVAGAFIGVGDRPSVSIIESEYGAYPHFVFLELVYTL